MTEQMLTSHRPIRQWTGPRSDTLADVLERVLDKGVVIVGDVVVSVVDVELLTLRLRLFIASADTAREMGLDWWMNDPFFSSKASRPAEGDLDELADENRRLQGRLEALEHALGTRTDAPAALPTSAADANPANVVTGRAAGAVEGSAPRTTTRSTRSSTSGGSGVTGRDGAGKP